MNGCQIKRTTFYHQPLQASIRRISLMMQFNSFTKFIILSCTLQNAFGSNLRAASSRVTSRQLLEPRRHDASIQLTSHVSQYGVVQESYILRLCAGRSDEELNSLIDYIEFMNYAQNAEETPTKFPWHADVRFEIRQLKFSTFMLCLDNVTTTALADLLSIKDVCAVTENGVVVASSVKSWGLDRIDQASLPLDGNYDTPLRGKGVDVYILDTGMDTLHDEFHPVSSERAVLNLWDAYDTVSSRCSPECGAGLSFNNDMNGHGSHCAGTVGGLSTGVAPGASLFGLKVLTDDGLGSFSVMIKAIDFVMTRAKQTGKPSIISMSISGGYYKPVNDMVNSAVLSGVVVSVAAGNSADNACLYSPASAESAITVGATASTDEASSFSNHGGCVTLYAPGSRVVSVKAGTTSQYTSFSGTSMACPHVAGTSALMLEADPSISPSQLMNTMLCMSKPHRLFKVENNDWSDSFPRYLLQAPTSSNIDIVDTFVEKTCFRPKRSESSCVKLGWTNAATYGSELVCGESDDTLGGCSGLMSWSAADSFCSNVGARLCSLDELQKDETRGTGCQYDSKLIWSSTDCDGDGHWLATGSTNAALATQCGTADGVNYARCCADKAPAPTSMPTSQPVPAPTMKPTLFELSCEKLGWTNAAKYGSELVCGESDDGALGGCSGLLTWEFADSFCSNVGARLCSSEELQNNEARGTGCGYDSKQLWSSSACSGGHYVEMGSSTFGTNLECVSDMNTEFATRCCADSESIPTMSPLPSPTLQPSARPTLFELTCDELGWTNAAKYGSELVCGESDDGALGGCSGLMSWSAADSFCSNVGARLCSLEELVNDETRATGCQYDSKLLWSSSACTGGGHFLAMGNSVFGTDAICGSPTGLNPVRCCADVIREPTSAPSKPPTSPPTQLPVPAPTMKPTLFELTCDELGWTNAAKYGSDQVCGESDQGALGGCSGLMSWSAADSFCSNVGARLCSSEELQNNEARGTGCGYDSKQLWSSSACSGGYYVEMGSSTFGTNLECVSDMNAEFATRCCADVGSAGASGGEEQSPTIAPAVSLVKLTCDELGWTNAAKFGSELVCGESDNGVPRGCSGLLSWSDADLFCSNVGAHLCSLEELENDEARGTGCQLNGKLVWSGTSCNSGGGYYVAPGSTLAAEAIATCNTETDDLHPARCCANTIEEHADSPILAPTAVPFGGGFGNEDDDIRHGLNPTVTPGGSGATGDYVPRTCEELGWTNAATYGSELVCGESDQGALGGCSGLMSWSAADSFCSNVGARLCSLEELQNNEASGTGCQYDLRYVWSSTGCVDDGHMVAFGSSENGLTTSCEPAGLDLYAVRCCADVQLLFVS